MIRKLILSSILLVSLLTGLFKPGAGVRAEPVPNLYAPQADISAADLIVAMNMLRVSNGYPALIEDPIIDAVAQATAQTMAANLMSWHIGNVSGRIQAAGYGGGAKVWATENFATGSPGWFKSIDQIMQVWADPAHMLPATMAAYCNVGAGIATASNGQVYYVLQAAYTTAKACGDYNSPASPSAPGGVPSTPIVPQIIIPVKVATPDADGRIYHVVQAGQTLWAIAVAYKVTVADLRKWNNLSATDHLYVGDKLFIPSSNTEGYFTPTPVGMVQVSTPDVDGKVVHDVQAYQSLSSIAQAYGVTVDAILALNNLKVDWPLQIGQKLVIRPSQVTPSPTPRPLTPIEKLTPASDGKYYHVVGSGQNLTWIASYYQVALKDLMAWNNLNSSSVLRLGQKLLLQVTPPATPTYTPGPPTATPTATATRPTPTPTATRSPTAVPPSSTPLPDPPAPAGDNTWLWVGLLGAVIVVGLAASLLPRRRQQKE